MLIITGSAGFIGSHVARYFDMKERLLLVDYPHLFRENNYFGPHIPSDWHHARGIRPEERHKIIDCTYFPKLLQKLKPNYQDSTKDLLPIGEEIRAVIHIGAITDTSRDRDIRELREWNTEYTKQIWQWCAEHKVPLVYASSAATYGLGEFGFSDDHSIIKKLKPLNPYALSKQDFDLWALEQIEKGLPCPPNWYGLKFFNVYGAHEGHKGRMASTILFSFRSIREKGTCQLFRSHRDDIKDGEQKRDFIFVEDLLPIIDFLIEKLPESGIYNCGSGKARSFYDMATAVFHAMGKTVAIDWVDTPVAFRESYQYFTEARLEKLRRVGFQKDFTALEIGVDRYVHWLLKALDEDALGSMNSN